MHLLKSKFVLIFSSVVFLLFFYSCTSTSTKTKDPNFNTEISVIQNDLNKIITSEKVNISGKEITANEKISSELEVSILNGKDIPADEYQMKALGRSIATIIKKALKNQNQYDLIVVLFVIESKNGDINKREWKGFEYKPNEL